MQPLTLQSIGYLVLSGTAAYLGASGNTLMQDYGFAAAFSGCVYSTYRALRALGAESKLSTALFTFGGCSVAELIQALHIPFVEQHPLFIGSVYDPKDFLAYAVGIGSALTLDAIME